MVRSTPTKIASIAYLFWIFWGPFHSTLPNRGLRTSAAGTREVEEEEEGSKAGSSKVVFVPLFPNQERVHVYTYPSLLPSSLFVSCGWGRGKEKGKEGQ